MRLLITNVLAAALLLFGAAGANAFSTSMTNSWGGGVASVGDTLTVTVSFDTDGGNDVSLLSVSVLFDDAIMSYDGGTSATYALYTGGKGASYLKPATTNNTLRVGTCLLYTSPSPRDRTRSRMPSSA